MTIATYRLRVGDGLMCDVCHRMVEAGELAHMELRQAEVGSKDCYVKVFCDRCHEKERGKQ